MSRVSNRSDLWRALALAVGIGLAPVSAMAEGMAGSPTGAPVAGGSPAGGPPAGDPWYGGDTPQYGDRGHSAYVKPAHDADYMVADGLIARPLGIASTIIGTGLFIVTLPFSFIGGNVDEASQVLVQEPANYTFGRCLGCF